VNEQRDEHTDLLLLDAGNALMSNIPVTAKTQGGVIIQAMNMMGYDAMTVGDKDLGLGPKVLQEREAEADFPFLSANLVYADSGELVFPPYTVVTVAGRKVGILGLSGSQEPMPREVGGGVVLDLLEPIEVARQYVDELSNHTDIIVVLSLMGLDADRELAQSVDGIDLIVGGASRNILGEPRLIPDTTTVVVQAGARGEWVGRVELSIDSGGVVTAATGSAPRLDDTFVDDTDMLAFVAKAKQEASGAQ
jgi:2',3'-cyclic-nucleotide 2'-phosphodiesterase (5'-nucleotidase family)